MPAINNAMNSVQVVFLLLNGVMSFEYRNLTCGTDTSPASVVYPGEADITLYPWMGLLYFPMYNKLYTNGVVLVTRQMVIGSAIEIHRLPKVYFRSRGKVIIGQKCGGQPISIRDYTYHPDFLKNTVSALVMIQLDLDNVKQGNFNVNVKQELIPICPPPDHFIEPEIYAISLSNRCPDLKIKLYRMQYVSLDKCQNYYRRSELNENSLWPRHTACARALTREKCVWNSGTVLVVKHDGRWRLLGFSIFGPGCGAPARFLDYGKYHAWVRRSASTVGLPAVTRIADNHLVLRRASSNIQRFGDCDPEEMKHLMYSDQVKIVSGYPESQFKYNITLVENVEYSCMSFKAVPGTFIKNEVNATLPQIYLRRWCSNPYAICHGFQFVDIRFQVEITFTGVVSFTVRAYGKEPAVVVKVERREKHPEIPTLDEIKKFIKDNTDNPKRYRWFYKSDT